MEEILKRIDVLINKCENYVDSHDYAKIVFEIKDLIIEICGASSIYFSQYNEVIQSDNTYNDSAKYFAGILNGVKNFIKLAINKKKYQIFISSTYRDLKNFRQIVSDEITFRGHISAGMEDFTACGEDLETYIKRVIDESDYFILILGQRWGTGLPKDNNVSYTMMEYYYAKSKGMRIIPLIYNGDEMLEGNDLKENGIKFENFKSEISNLVPQYFKDETQIIRNVTKALDRELKMHPAKGWIRL